jgi:hypothetical protein
MFLVWSGLVWFITGAGSRHYVCVVGAAPLQRHPTVLYSVCPWMDHDQIQTGEVRGAARACTGPSPLLPIWPVLRRYFKRTQMGG